MKFLGGRQWQDYVAIAEKAADGTFGFRSLLVVCVLIAGALQFAEAQKLLRDTLAGYLMNKHVQLPHCGEDGKNSGGAIYVLGGSPKSVEKKFVTAARLYHGGIGARILFLSEPGIMEYSTLMKRNKNYDEWATDKLKNLGVHIDDIKAVSVPSGFWGTLSEAKSIPNIIARQGYSRLVLVSSSYHARRTWVSFRRYAEKQNVKLCMYSSDEKVSLQDCVQELLKVVVYQIFLV